MAEYLLAICAASRPGRYRMTEGDVVAVLDPDYRPGVKEAGLFLFVPVEMTSEEADRFRIRGWYDGEFNPDNPPPMRNKYRHKLPLAKLKEKLPTFDIEKAHDENDKSQPFLSEPVLLDTSAKEALFYDRAKAGFRYNAGAVEVVDG